MKVFAVGNGQLNFEMVFHGTAVHSSHPEDGRNAIGDAAAFIRLVEEESRRLAERSVSGDRTGDPSQVGLVSRWSRRFNGRGSLRAQPRSRACCRPRAWTTPDAQVRGLSGTPRRRPAGRAMRAVAERRLSPLAGDDRRELDEVLHRALVRTSGGTTSERSVAMRFATDATWYEAAGCAAVVFGPGDVANLADRPDEHVPVGDLTTAAACSR